MALLEGLGGLFGGSTTDPSSIWGGQSPWLQQLYNRANQASSDPTGTGYASQFLNPAFMAFNQMAGGGAQIPGLMQGLQNFGNMQNEALGGAIQAGLGDITRNFQENIMPGINTGAALSGTSGGSRQGIAQGLAAGRANQQAGDFVNQMRSQNFQNMMQNQLGAYGQLGNLQNQQNQAMRSAMGFAPSLANLGFLQQYGNLQNLQGLYGPPTVLGGGSQTYPGLQDLFSFNIG